MASPRTSLLNRKGSAADVENFLMSHGYDYAVENSNNLDCPICRSPFIKPVMTPCNHIFCQTCINESLSTQKSCPVCRLSIANVDQLSSAPLLIHAMVNELIVKCPNQNLGCKFQDQRQNLRFHLINDCHFLEIVCPCYRQGCETVVRKCDLNLHINQCPFTLVPCPMGCGHHVKRSEIPSHSDLDCPNKVVPCPHCGETDLTRANLKNHLEKDCVKVTVACPNAKFGCQWKGSREILKEEHLGLDLGGCPYESIKAYLIQSELFQTQTSRENFELKKKLSEMEKRQEEMMKLIINCQSSLGSFAIPVSAHTTASMADTPTANPIRMHRHYSAVPHSNTSHAAFQQSLSSPSSPYADNTEPDSESDSDYDEDEDPAAFEDLSNHRVLLDRIGSSSFSLIPPSNPVSPVDEANVSFSPVSPSVISPVNITSTATLPSTIDHLSASLANLKASMERLEVRQEVGVMNEALRLQEELQSLRAGLHGVRLQLAYLLMEHDKDRPANENPGESSQVNSTLNPSRQARARALAYSMGYNGPISGPLMNQYGLPNDPFTNLGNFDSNNLRGGPPRRLGFDRQNTKL